MHATSEWITLQFDAVNLVYSCTLGSYFIRPSGTQTGAELLTDATRGADKGQFVARSRHEGYEEIGVWVLSHVSEYELWVLRGMVVREGTEDKLASLRHSQCAMK